MKVLGLMASPREKGSSASLLDRALRQAKDFGAEVETLNIARMNIGGCRACMGCKSGNYRCLQIDEMQQVYRAIEDSQWIWLATPVYGGQVSSQAKSLLDRLFAYLDGEMNWRLNSKTMLSIIYSQGSLDREYIAPYRTYNEAILGRRFQWMGDFLSTGHQESLGETALGIGRKVEEILG